MKLQNECTAGGAYLIFYCSHINNTFLLWVLVFLTSLNGNDQSWECWVQQLHHKLISTRPRMALSSSNFKHDVGFNIVGMK